MDENHPDNSSAGGNHSFGRRPKPSPTSIENLSAVLLVQSPPLSRRQVAQFELADSHANQPQRRMAHGSGHAAHLAILALHELKREPGVGDAFADSDRRGGG